MISGIHRGLKYIRDSLLDLEGRMLAVEGRPQGRYKFATVADMVAAADISEGDLCSVEDYATGSGSGVLFFNAVAAGTGVADGGSFIDSIGSTAIQFKQNFPSRVSVKQFGAVGDGVVNDGPAIQTTINYQIQNEGGVFFPHGRYRHDNQLTISAGAGKRCRVDLIGDARGAILESHVVGSVAGYDADGFAMLIDGLYRSRFSNLRLDYSNGTAGMVLRCRTESTYANLFENLYIVGGAAVADRENAARESVRYVGNEASANSAGNVVYFNRFSNCNFNIGYRHIRHVIGDGDPGTAQPNANMGDGCLFERFIIGVDVDDTDENQYSNLWFHSADGVVGINDGFVDCVRIVGTMNAISFIAEPGLNSRPYNIRSGAENNVLDIIQNTSNAGEDVSSGLNLIRDRSRQHGLSRVNHLPMTTDNTHDINYFGDGVSSHAGAGRQAVNIWDQGGNASKMSLGFDSSSRAVLRSDRDIRLEPGPGKTVYAGDGAWDGNPLRMGVYHLWIDTAGKLRIKSSAPVSALDGVVVGAQS